MKLSKQLSKKTFAIYGLGLSGTSVLKFLNKSKVRKIYKWDDKKKINNKSKSSQFIKGILVSDYIVVSPGIDIKKSKFSNILLKNKKKIITDLDLFYMQKLKSKTIVITGTNGKSTTSKLLEHVLKNNYKNVQLGGNIGKPILELNINNKSIVIIEASSFQLEYSKFIKPTFAALINITKDHLDWHKTMKNYVGAKFNIFLKQDTNNYAFIKDQKLISKFKNFNFLSKLNVVKKNSIKHLKANIKNKHLLSKPNEENLEFVLAISKKFGIKNKVFLKKINTFKELPHRHEIFFKKRNITFIDDSKATSFIATKSALQTSNDILWIVGGIPKLGDKMKINKINKNIIKSYIIGKKTHYFQKQLKGKINYKISHNLDDSLKHIFEDIRKLKNKNITVLLSPASASFDQFNNFVERGNRFKYLVKKYAKKYF